MGILERFRNSILVKVEMTALNAKRLTMNGNLDPDEVISERLLRDIKSRVLYRTGMGRYSLVYDVTSYSEEVRAMTKRALMDLGFECFTIGDAAECSERYFQVVWR